MPTVHYISREASRKIDPTVFEPPSKKTKIANLTTSVTHEAINDGTIRAEDRSDTSRTDADDIMNVNNHEEEQKPAAVVNLKTFSSYKLNYVKPHSSITEL
jgi:di/tripeptidase